MARRTRNLGVLVSTAVVAVAMSANAQINLLANQIVFRTAGTQTQATTHNGAFNATANSQYYGVSGVNTYTTASGGSGPYGIYGQATSAGNYGTGGRFDGGRCGVMGVAGLTSGGTNIAGDFSASFATNGYGIRAYAWGAGVASGTTYGVYASASGAKVNWAGYFAGNTFCTAGLWTGSDEGLKTRIAPVQSALSQIIQLQPKTYYFDTTAHPKMNLPAKRQYGLVAQDLQEVFPEMVMDVPEPDTAAIETKTQIAGRTQPRTFKAVNYTQLIAVLIAGMQEQQKEIQALKRAIGAE